MTTYSEWKIHNGGPCPVPKGTQVQIQTRDESRIAAEFSPACLASNLIWCECGVDTIIAYRIVEDERWVVVSAFISGAHASVLIPVTDDDLPDKTRQPKWTDE